MHWKEGIVMSPRSEASKKAQYKYNAAHLKRIPLDVKLEYYDGIKAAADAAGETVNGYIKKAIEMRMAADLAAGSDQ